MSDTIDLPTHRLTICPWPDAVIDQVGHDPRSTYVERFWLGILGPSTTWLLRRLADGLDDSPDGFELDLPDTARSLGLGAKGGRHSPFMRAIARTAQFGMAQPFGADALAVRRKVPPLTRNQAARLPMALQEEHQRWVEQRGADRSPEHMRKRARRLALSLVELGEDFDATERQLHRWQFHPAVAHDAATWAWDRHLAAASAAATASAATAASSPDEAA